MGGAGERRELYRGRRQKAKVRRNPKVYKYPDAELSCTHRNLYADTSAAVSLSIGKRLHRRMRISSNFSISEQGRPPVRNGVGFSCSLNHVGQRSSPTWIAAQHAPQRQTRR
ncbi:hypothetical protein GW17_00008673 [Ensete ventricosum]|nr:hypothetical protein GW17_00008673 [Ensete ventricosum]